MFSLDSIHILMLTSFYKFQKRIIALTYYIDLLLFLQFDLVVCVGVSGVGVLAFAGALSAQFKRIRWCLFASIFSLTRFH